MTTDPHSSENSKRAGAGPAHIGGDVAERITRDECQAELAAFVNALGMQRPVPVEKVAHLLERSMKDAMSANASLIEDQMRLDQWDGDLSNGETLGDLANRALRFLDTAEGVRLYNFFAKTYARTTGEIFDKPLGNGPAMP